MAETLDETLQRHVSELRGPGLPLLAPVYTDEQGQACRALIKTYPALRQALRRRARPGS